MATHDGATAEVGFLARLASQILPPHPDPRTDAYPLMSSWPPTALISLAYVFGVYAWRNELQKRSTFPNAKNARNDAHNTATNKNDTGNRAKSWNMLTCLMVLYNAIMVMYSAYLAFGTLIVTQRLGYGLGCEEQPDPADRSTDKLLHFGYLFYFSKFVEMLDTLFFLWRGKVDQVTFLHVFHHATMPPSIWWGVRYAPGGIVYTFLVANSFIHVIMYTYYGLAAAGLYKYLWWKNYLTIAQMVQFIILIVHQGQIFVRSTPCDYPKIFPAAIVFYSAVFLILFGNFYIQAYWRKQRLAKRTTRKSDCNGHVTNGHVMANGSMTNGRPTLTTGETETRERKRQK